MELIVVSSSLVPECAAAADERKKFLDLVLVEVLGSEELVEAPESVVAEVPAAAAAADSFHFFAWLLAVDASIVLFLALLSRFLAASLAFLACSSALFAASFSFFSAPSLLFTSPFLLSLSSFAPVPLRWQHISHW